MTATPDHVAVAVHAIDAAADRWVEQLGGTFVAPVWDDGSGFRTRQVRFRGGGKLELLEPVAADGFAQDFLDRYGPRIHHVTLKVPDLRTAVTEVEAAGYDVVDVDDRDPVWREGFLRPSQVGGIIVQLAETSVGDDDWAREAGVEVPEPRADAPALVGPTLTSPDLDAARRLWATLGATVADDRDALLAVWPGTPLSVRVEPGLAAGPTGLRFTPDPGLPSDDTAGPMTLPV
ncbi:hypothetical protein FTX61_12295 [Nitriliruptoraceae bacterium ZYF776]|nr:hypothetical protein [Profundirhabdus halotolerans]